MARRKRNKFMKFIKEWWWLILILIALGLLVVVSGSNI